MEIVIQTFTTMRKSLFLATLFCIILCNAEAKEPTSYNYQRGIEALRDGETNKGIDLLNRELQDHPKCGYTYAWIASARGRLCDYGKALTAVNYALKYLPKKDKYYVAWAHRLRALTYIYLGDSVAALSDYAQAIKLQPETYDYYRERGDLYFELKQYDLSNVDYLHMIKLEPGNTDGYMGYGRNLREQDKLNEAIEQFSYAFKLDKDFSQALAFRAECYAKQHKYEEAVADMIKAIEMDENRKAIYQLVYIDKEGVDDAIAQLKVQMAKNPNTPYWFTFAGMIYE
jgi:tetratricopeptide (TPR) repeat protein